MWTRRTMLAIATTAVTTPWRGAATSASVADRHESRHPFGRPLVFAHRGASGERPEHTLGAYRLALEQAADYVEPDLRLTQDGVFVCLHDATLERTTDVADRAVFAARARRDAKGAPRWHVGDFTLAEIKSLRTRQGHSGRSHEFDGVEPIPTFTELVDLVRRHNLEQGTRVGITPEIKSHDAEAFLAFVRRHGLESGEPGPAVPLHVQSFDLATVLAVRPRLASPCVWLTAKRPADEVVADLAGRIDGISIAKASLLGDDAAGFVARLHAAGLCVIGWTFAADRHDAERFGSPDAELAAALDAGVDAFFTDFPAAGVRVRDRLHPPR